MLSYGTYKLFVVGRKNNVTSEIVPWNDEIQTGLACSKISWNLQFMRFNFALLNMVLYTRYALISTKRARAQEQFWNMHRRRHGRRFKPYLAYLQEVLPFFEWLRKEIEDANEQGMNMPNDVEDSSTPPSIQAQRFRIMYAYGYHFRVKSAEEGFSKTCDSGVAAMFHRSFRSGRLDHNPVHAVVEYIGQILEIVELNYE